MADVALAIVFFIINFENQDNEFDSVAEEQILVHLLVLDSLFGHHVESCREQIRVEDLGVRLHLSHDILREILELLHKLGEEGVLGTFNIASLHSALE